MDRWPVKWATRALARSSAPGDRVVVEPGVDQRRPRLLGIVGVGDPDQSKLAPDHRHGARDGISRCPDLRHRMMVGDDILLLDIRQEGHRRTAPSALAHRDDGAGKGPSSVQHVDLELEFPLGVHGPDEDGVGRADR